MIYNSILRHVQTTKICQKLLTKSTTMSQILGNYAPLNPNPGGRRMQGLSQLMHQSLNNISPKSIGERMQCRPPYSILQWFHFERARKTDASEEGLRRARAPFFQADRRSETSRARERCVKPFRRHCLRHNVIRASFYTTRHLRKYRVAWPDRMSHRRSRCDSPWRTVSAFLFYPTRVKI